MPAEAVRKARKLLRLLPEPLWRRGLRLGVAATVEHEAIPFGLEHRCVVDAGAGRGQFALFARRRFPAAELICFEPQAEARSSLDRVAKLIGTVRVFPMALGAEDGEAEMFLAADGDCSSLRPPTDAQLRAFPATREVDRETVAVVRLDEVLGEHGLPGPALLKIDVQGGELDLLHGADALLDRFAEVLVECSYVELYEGQPLADEVASHLEGRGFEFVGRGAVARDSAGRPLQADLLFRRGGRPT